MKNTLLFMYCFSICTTALSIPDSKMPDYKTTEGETTEDEATEGETTDIEATDDETAEAEAAGAGTVHTPIHQVRYPYVKQIGADSFMYHERPNFPPFAVSGPFAAVRFYPFPMAVVVPMRFLPDGSVQFKVPRTDLQRDPIPEDSIPWEPYSRKSHP